VPAPVSASTRLARRLKIIGTIILLLGIVSAGIVYWLGVRSQDSSDDASMLGYNKPETQQMERLYGKWGDFTDGFLDDLKQPGTQAILLLVFSGLSAAGCFYFARLLNDGDEPADESR
jgi:hypothetical protein